MLSMNNERLDRGPHLEIIRKRERKRVSIRFSGLVRSVSLHLHIYLV